MQCVNLFAFRDNIVEEPNIFEVVIKLNAQNATINTSRVNVVITDANIGKKSDNKSSYFVAVFL